ncbi:bone morphogenetic protein 8B [Colossoma macropomum]|uniref:bone morphogenetic protein 8B n=1 Tax=Colossoma macropomum TaxID=42526 RepID=UPI001864F665|nr:bone morphogenetic protein 8B [Colossoma macropomum]
MSGVSVIFTTRTPKKDPVMQSSVFFVIWMVFFSSGLGEPTDLLDYTGTDQDLQLEALKATLLENLGMDGPPKTKEKTSYRDLFRLYHQYRNLRRNMQPLQSSSRFFLPATVQPLSSQQGQSGSEPVQWFRAVFHRDTRVTEEFTLGCAQLKLQTRPAGDSFSHPALNPNILIRIHRNSSSLTETIFHMELFNAEGHSVTVEVTAAVERWFTQTNDTVLVVDVGLLTGTPEATPELSLELEQLVSSVREARSANEDDGHCSRKSRSVSFEEIGWSDWIIAPSGYTMFFCDGSCPHNYKPASMHTQVKSRLHRLTKGATPRPCCVPAAYEPMILMHYDSRGKLKLTSFNDLIVSKCYCA